MQEERRPLDPTRRLLRVFGVTVTDYEERTAALVEQAAGASASDRGELLRLAVAAIELTADLNTRLREINNHVLETQTRVLAELKEAFERVQS